MDLREIEEEIIKLEKSDTNYSNVQRLSYLYTVRDHMTDDKRPVLAAKTAEIMPCCDGEFGQCVAGAEISAFMEVMNEHMSLIKMLHPKEYNAVIKRIQDSKGHF